MTATARPHPTGGAAAPAAAENSGGADVRRFWSAYAVSALGSGVGAGALPLMAIMVVHATDWQVSLLAVLGGLAGVAIAVPLGPSIEFHRKRPVMIGADLLRFAALASVPVTAWFGTLGFAQLCAVAVVQTAATIVSTAASNLLRTAGILSTDPSRSNAPTG